MEEQKKKKIRPLYNELQGYLAQAPTAKYISEPFDDKTQWEYVNNAIDRLNTSTGNNYDQFKIVEGTQDSIGGRAKVVRVNTFKAMLGGLISYLHGEYYYDEPSPLNGVPSTVINQNQSQQQSVNVLLLEMQKKIDEKLDTTDDEKEIGFLKRLEKLLPSVTNGVQLVKAVADLTAQMGLDPHQISRLFT